MGGSRWDPGDWDTYATASVRGKSSAEIFTSRHLKDEYDPAKIDFRESCDSEENPNSTPIILASDVTGSMGMIAHHLMTEGLNTLITEIYDRAPVVDPHVMVLAIGDTTCDSAPLQATQFEADICLADQVRELWVEGGGGGNFGESYSGAHLFAAMKTRTDSIRKRNKKGFLFTIGDEPNNDGMTAEEAQRIGMPLEADVTAAQAVALAQRDWEVYHVVLTNVGRCMYNKDEVMANWHAILPERTIPLQDVNALAETVVSILQVHAGADVKTVTESWSGDTSLTVATAIGAMTAHDGGSGGLTRLA